MGKRPRPAKSDSSSTASGESTRQDFSTSENQAGEGRRRQALPSRATSEPSTHRRESVASVESVEATERDDTLSADRIPTKTQRPRRRWLRRVSLAVIGMGTLVGFAPSLISWAPVRHRIVSYAASSLPCSVEIESASLAWWRPITLQGLRIQDERSRPYLQVARVQSERTLAQLLWRRNDLGRWTIDSPHADIQVRADGSNWEDLLAKLPSSQESSSNELPTGEFILRDVHLEVSDPSDTAAASEASKRSWPACDVHIQLAADGRSEMTFQVQSADPTGGSVAELENAPPPGRQSARVAIEGKLTPKASDESAYDADIQVALRDFPLELLEPIAIRAGQPLQVEGALSGKVQAKLVLSDRLQIEPLEAEIVVHQWKARSPLWQNETIASDQSNLHLKFGLDGERLQISTAHLKTDWADARLQGTILTDRLSSLTTGSLDALAADVATQGTVDLARLASQLPHTLALREDLSWQTGELTWKLDQQPQEQGRLWRGQVMTRNLAAERAGRRIELSDPLVADFQLAQTDQNWIVQDVSVKSAFLVAQGRGDLDGGELQMQADLARLFQESGQFIDLGSQEFGGRLQADLKWSSIDSLWNLTARLVGDQVEWRDGANRLWQETKLVADLSGSARLRQGQLSELVSGRLQIQSQQDRLDVTIKEPLQGDGPTNVSWPVEAQVAGELSTWQNRLRPLVDMGTWTARGELSAQLTMNASTTRCDIADCQIQSRNLAITDGQSQWQEPVVQLRTQASVDLNSQQVRFGPVTLASTSLSLRADGLHWPLEGGTEKAVVQYRGDLARLYQQLVPDATSRPRGQLAGKIHWQPTAQEVQFLTTANVQDFQWESLTSTAAPGVAGQAVSIWQEPSIDMRMEGAWQVGARAIQLQQARLQTQAAAVQFQGQILELDGPLVSQLQGTTRVDMDQLSARLRPLYGDQIRLTGTIDRPFQAKGPLLVETPASPAATRLVSRSTEPTVSWVSRELQGQAGLGWQSASVFGFELGTAAIDATLAEQAIRIAPIDLEVSGGKLHLEPQIQLQHSPTLTLPAGPIISRVQITPAMCQSWLKYVAAVVADATTAEGTFSANVRSAVVPLLEPTRAQLDAQVQIHSARIGPGPVAQEILGWVQQARTLLDPQRGASRLLAKDAAWVAFPEQTVECRMQDERVYHKNLQMLIGDTQVRTEGWVDLNNRLSIVAEIAIPDDWVADRRWLAGLRGQPLRIPIQGTLQRPQIDRSILQQLANQAARGAAEGLIQEEVQKQIQRFLPDLLPK